MSERVTALAWQSLGKPDEALPLWREARELYALADVSAGVQECANADESDLRTTLSRLTGTHWFAYPKPSCETTATSDSNADSEEEYDFVDDSDDA